MEDPSINTYDGASRDVVAADLGSSRRDVAFEEETDAGVQAHSLFHDGTEVRKVVRCFFVADRIAQFTGVIGVVDFSNESA